MRTLRALVEITRADSALLGWLSVFVPCYSRTTDAWASAGQALPILLICMATFVANDLDDVSKDEINHPSRPLPSKQLAGSVATAIFFACLTSALFATKHLVDEHIAFWYYALTVAAVTYGYVVEYFPSLKTVYVAACAAAPIVIVGEMFPDESELLIVASAVFLAIVGRETCMDIRDRAGDRPSWMHSVNPSAVGAVAIAIQGIAIAIVTALVRSPLHVAAVLAMAAALIAATSYWFSGRMRIAIGLMKVQIAIGLVFLI